jgi:glycosyltransferase involved in cell wall biosynthesis
VIRHISVVIPAADEASRISACLEAVLDAESIATRRDDERRVGIVVVLDRCRDETAQVVARYPSVTAVPTALGNVGAARRLGAQVALAKWGSTCDHWIANSDADSIVPGSWLVDMCAFADAGADVVLGTVVPRGLPASVHSAWRSRHDLRDGHSHVHGANFGIRASTYVALGGWRPVHSGEDADLARRAARTAGVTVQRTAAIPVATSGRREGRAPRGFAAYVKALSQPELQSNPAP